MSKKKVKKNGWTKDSPVWRKFPLWIVFQGGLYHVRMHHESAGVWSTIGSWEDKGIAFSSAERALEKIGKSPNESRWAAVNGGFDENLEH